MIHMYDCFLPWTDQPPEKEWIATLRLIRKSPDSCEAEIHARDSYFHLITGKHRYGTYLCIPNLFFCCDIPEYSDLRLIYETLQMAGIKNETDLITLTEGIYELDHLPDVN